MCKQQKSIKALKFGDHQNSINDAISTGVVVDDWPSLEYLNNVPSSNALQNSMQHDSLLDAIVEEETVHPCEDANHVPDEIIEDDEVEI